MAAHCPLVKFGLGAANFDTTLALTSPHLEEFDQALAEVDPIAGQAPAEHDQYCLFPPFVPTHLTRIGAASMARCDGVMLGVPRVAPFFGGSDLWKWSDHGGRPPLDLSLHRLSEAVPLLQRQNRTRALGACFQLDVRMNDLV